MLDTIGKRMMLQNSTARHTCVSAEHVRQLSAVA